MKLTHKAKVGIFLTLHPGLRRTYCAPAPTAHDLAEARGAEWKKPDFDPSADYDAVQNLAACEAPPTTAA